MSTPSLLSPLPLPLILLHFTVLINHDCKTSCGMIQDGLFTNWQFGSLIDPNGCVFTAVKRVKFANVERNTSKLRLLLSLSKV